MPEVQMSLELQETLQREAGMIYTKVSRMLGLRKNPEIF